MFPVIGLARLAGRILSTFHMENFSPVTGLNSVGDLKHKNITYYFLPEFLKIMLSLFIQQREIFFAIKSFEKGRNDAACSFALLRQKSMPPGNRADLFIREYFQPSLTEISVGETEISVTKPACLLI